MATIAITFAIATIATLAITIAAIVIAMTIVIAMAIIAISHWRDWAFVIQRMNSWTPLQLITYSDLCTFLL